MPTRRSRDQAIDQQVPLPTAPEVRRRPRQSRAQQSEKALRDAFVRVLLERGYAKTTIREVAAVAGVGVGTFYEYFGNMRALAAKWISDTVKDAERQLRQTFDARCGQPATSIVDAMIDTQVRTILDQAQTWTLLFTLERQISTPSAFRRHYDAWVQTWGDALACASDPPPADRLPMVARMVHAVTYGWISQCLLTAEPPLSEQTLRDELKLAVHGYMQHSRTMP
ncbi:TetR/AcrR family transcriptional regulator [Variovorax dokdonensis]|uniref:TetR/AcrR family transcriptional regulator n=1 Tax=Variovorax dokdonensis TaxID=344883 RepID=A0ABT7NCF2_9BURK|nr:TetR/AcrR family transcriptional regulator [Variovorax dokdonensis]MDM0045530.1 TetR/AcrR family transcriptional regulator [Variovorax dokdonensis]